MEENKFLEQTQFRKKSSEKEIIRVIKNEIKDLRNYTHEVISMAKQNEYDIALNLISSKIISVSNEMSEFLNNRYMELDSLEEEKGRLKNEVKTLKEKLEDKENKDREELKNLTGRMEAFMELVEENVKAVAVSKKIKTASKQGKQKDTRIPDEEVIELYNSGKTPTEIANYYNTKYGGTIVTMAGIRGRLKNLGVYKQKWTQR